MDYEKAQNIVDACVMMYGTCDEVEHHEARGYLAALEGEEVKGLIEALKKSSEGLNCWLHFYAPKFCDEEKVKEFRKMMDHGTLSYIAEVNQVIEHALSKIKEKP